MHLPAEIVISLQTRFRPDAAGEHTSGIAHPARVSSLRIRLASVRLRGLRIRWHAVVSWHRILDWQMGLKVIAGQYDCL